MGRSWDMVDRTRREADGPAWHCLDAEETLTRLDTGPGGLGAGEAARRLAQHGPNELADRGARHPARLFLEQFTSLMVVILLGAAGLSVALGKLLEAGAILAIVFLFAVLGFVQEYRAERAIAALKRLAVPWVRVTRDGRQQAISAAALVPGDLVSLETGNFVPADLRLRETVNLRVQEAALTGESEPVEKDAVSLTDPALPLGDRRNLAYRGTVVSYGRGEGVVVATGMDTELGRIAGLLQEVRDEATPLQRRIERVGKLLAAGGTVVAVLVMAAGLLAGEPWEVMVLAAISVAVAVVPEGLPAVLTFTLALATQRMLRRNALIRRLPAVETLGSVTTICSDKTGTLTENRMTVTILDVAGHRLDLVETMRRRMPAVEPGRSEAGGFSAIGLVLAGGALCNDAVLQAEARPGHFHALGDPTEGALLVAAVHGGMSKADLERVMPRVGELPFDSDRKRMTTVHRRPGAGAEVPSPVLAAWGEGGLAPDCPHIVVTKGAVDRILEVTERVWDGDGPVSLDADFRRRIQAAHEDLADDGMRVLGVAFRPAARDVPAHELERGLIFLGMVGMIDPPRPEVRAAIATCKAAGIRPVMITGDHPLTAATIARDLGIGSDGSPLTGAILDGMGDEELERIAEQTAVYARVSPEHKLRIVRALRRRGHVVAMTGDGVNDAPALRLADIGVAMGVTGTDVTREAADIVLRDDNFATIVAAVEEGRTVYDNIRRFVKFAVAGNIGKVGAMLLWPMLSAAAGAPPGSAVALLPLQLLWLNLMTDGLLGMSMGREPAEENVMARPPNPPRAGLFTGTGWHVLWVGGFIGATSLAVGAWYYGRGLEQWQTMIFTTMGLTQVFHALVTRSAYRSIFRMSPVSNPLLLLIVPLVVAMQLAAVYLPFLREVLLQLVPLSGPDLAVSAAVSASLLAAVEFEKLFIRRRRQGEAGVPGC
ncbi:MAG TPA: ATPase [Clostridiales bacterium]|nr:ATPase [Clostridiales bacterium]